MLRQKNLTVLIVHQILNTIIIYKIQIKKLFTASDRRPPLPFELLDYPYTEILIAYIAMAKIVCLSISAKIIQIQVRTLENQI